MEYMIGFLLGAAVAHCYFEWTKPHLTKQLLDWAEEYLRHKLEESKGEKI